MNIKQTKKALKLLREKNLVPLLVGPHGSAKSSTVRQFANESGLAMIDLRLGLMEPGDLIGLPDLSNGTTRFNRPAFLPTSGSGVLFLDEINRASRPVLQAVFQLILDRRINEYVLPEGWSIVAAMNPSSEDYVVTDLADHALLSRFVHIDAKSELGEFCDFMGEGSAVADFIRQQPKFRKNEKTINIFEQLSPCDRSWEFASRITDADDDIRIELLMGILGVPAAVAFEQYLKDNARLPTGAEILAGRGLTHIKKAVQEARFDVVNTLIDSTVDEVTRLDGREQPAQLEHLRDFMLVLPADFFVGMAQKLPENHKVGEFYAISQKYADSLLVAYQKESEQTEPKKEAKRKKAA